MSIFLLPVPLWLLLTVVVIIALLFDYRHRRLQRQVKMLDREFASMDRWAEAVDERFNLMTLSVPPRAANTARRPSNEPFLE